MAFMGVSVAFFLAFFKFFVQMLIAGMEELAHGQRKNTPRKICTIAQPNLLNPLASSFSPQSPPEDHQTEQQPPNDFDKIYHSQKVSQYKNILKHYKHRLTPS
jgi:hypothetical protein